MTLCMSVDVINEIQSLPSGVQKKVTAFFSKFKENRRSNAINLERIANTEDDKLYSVRIDQKYRAIIAYQKESGVYLVLYIANHDDAYAWAARKRVGVNAYTHAIQIVDSITVEEQNAAIEDVRKPAKSFAADIAAAGITAGNVVTAAEPVPVAGKTANAAGSPVAKVRKPEARKPVMAIRRTGTLPDTYRSLTEDDMLRFGVPDIYIPIMLNVADWEKFEEWNNRLPSDPRTYLQLVAEGQTKYEVRALIDDGADGRSDKLGLEKNIPAMGQVESDLPEQDDFQTALANYATQQSFVVVEGEKDLKRLLDAPLESWRVFLHASQRAYVERNYSGSFRLTGAAGTGKTVVAMHRAKYLASKLVQAHSRQKVLFTTYSANLAVDIQSNLKLICTSDEFKRIDVINLDKLVWKTLREKGYDYNICYEGSLVNGRRLEDVWDEAMHKVSSAALANFNSTFFMDEWSQVIIPQRIGSVGEYLRCLRKGRGTRLSRPQKVAVWQVMETYQQLMRNARACDIDMAMNMVATWEAESEGPRKYAHIVVDEGQDFSVPAYRVLRSLVENKPNDLFIVGDAQQRIYGRKTVLSQCGINIQGRARRLKINYRTTEQTRAAADRIFDNSGRGIVDDVFDALKGVTPGGQPMLFDDLDGNEDKQSVGDSRSLVSGPEPEGERFPSSSQEHDYVRDWIYDLCGDWDENKSVAEQFTAGQVDPRDICVAVRTNELAKEWERILDDELPYGAYRLGKDEEDRQRRGIRVATMHRVKGLEFDYVIVADVNEGLFPPRAARRALDNDPVALRDRYCQERSLLYVAMTRARKAVLVTGVAAR